MNTKYIKWIENEFDKELAKENEYDHYVSSQLILSLAVCQLTRALLEQQYSNYTLHYTNKEIQ